MLTTLIMAGCMGDADPVRVSLDIDASDLVMNIGETSTRAGSSKAADSHLTYSTDNPSVATVNQDGKVTARSIGEATITVHMDEDRKDWYAATDRTYRVVVKVPSAEQLRRIDRDTPLTLVAQEDGKITITFCGGITLSADIIYTINGGAEQIISKNTKGAFDIVVKKHDFVQLFSANDALSSGIAAGARGATRAVDDGAKYINIKPAMKTEIYGNVMSMFKGENFEDDHEIDAAYALYGLFAGAEKLVNNSFRHIELPAYKLADGCYQDMFYGCKGIERAPDLPAEKTTKNCYKEMFAGCSKLSYLKCQADDISAEGCTKDWLAGAGSEVTEVKTLVTAFDFPANSNDGVPAGWTNELIYPVKSVTLNKTSLEMTVGSTETGTAILTAEVDPAYASDKTVFWLTSNKNVATVDDHGKVTAVGSGEAKITATAGGKTATCTVKVDVPATSVSISGADAINAGSRYTGQLTATVTPATATDASVTWSSSAPDVLSVDANGKVSLVALPASTTDVTITATSNADASVKGTTVISVIVSVPATGVSISGADAINAGNGYTGQLTATVTPATATNQTVTWSSSHPGILSVNSDGKVSLVALPASTTDVTITATSNADASVKGTTVISVSDPSVSLASASVGMVIGKNGKAYNTVALANTYSTAAAIIAYKGAAGTADKSSSATSYVGLAIALTDVNNTYQWCTENYCTHMVPMTTTLSYALSMTEGFGKGIENTSTLAYSNKPTHTHDAAYQAMRADDSPKGTRGWFLPTIGQWNLIVKGMCGGDGDLTSSENSNYKADKFNVKITAAGGTGVKNGNYWSSDECGYGNAWTMDFDNGSANNPSITSSCNVRLVLAF